MTDDQATHTMERIDAYLVSLSKRGLAAPAGIHWQRLFNRITRGYERDEWPQNPLILGGAIASPEHKQERLREHLIWAAERGKLDEALTALDRVPNKGWNILLGTLMAHLGAKNEEK